MNTPSSTLGALLEHMALFDGVFGTTQESTEMTGSDTSTQSNVNSTVENPFPFMELPLELRIKVYEFHLVFPKSLSINIGSYFHIAETMVCKCPDVHSVSPKGCVPFDKSILNILSASKDSYFESVPVFFGSNVFKFLRLDSLRDFLSYIAPTSRRNITTVALGYHGIAPAKALKLLRGCTGLRRLTIFVTWSTVDLVPFGCNLMKLPGLKHLLKIRGIKELQVIADESSLIFSFLNESVITELQEALQVLKEPSYADRFARQENKGGTVCGKANVKTREEKKLLALDPPASPYITPSDLTPWPSTKDTTIDSTCLPTCTTLELQQDEHSTISDCNPVMVFNGSRQLDFAFTFQHTYFLEF